MNMTTPPTPQQVPDPYQQQAPIPQQYYGQYPQSPAHKTFMPSSELQFNMMTTESGWGKPEINPEISEVLTEVIYYKDVDGNLVPVEIKKLWDRFSIYTRDVRLGNLDGADMESFKYDLDLAFQLLQNDMYRSSAIALGYAVTVVESSQSKKGFLRRRMNTLTSENINHELEPAKKSLFGGKKDNGY